MVLTPANEKKSNAGRKPIDVIVMFRCNRFTIFPTNRSSMKCATACRFTRFLRLGIEDGIPDGTTLWLSIQIRG